MHDIVRDALETSGRVNDESYFARVLFSRMIERDIHGETGYGIAPYAPDQDAGNRMVHIDYTHGEGYPGVDYNYTEG